MKEKVSINDRSIESAGIPKDYKEALSELIWNGFDAGATRVELVFDANEIEHVSQLTIRDNGTGDCQKDPAADFWDAAGFDQKNLLPAILLYPWAEGKRTLFVYDPGASRHLEHGHQP